MNSEMKATKLGESDKEQEQNASTSKVDLSDLNLNLKGTLLGEESDFEKSLKGINKETTTAVKPTEIKTEEKTENKSTEDDIKVVTEKTEPTTAKEEKIELNEDNADDFYGIALKSYREGENITGTVISIDRAGIFVDIRFKCEGFISNEELGNNPAELKKELNVGEEIFVQILKLETKEGYTLLSKKRADYELTWKNAYKAYKTKEVIDVKVINAVKGGLVVYYNEIKGFIPASLVWKAKEAPLTDFVGSTISAILIEVDKKRKKVIFSGKLPDQNKMDPKDNPYEKLEVGQVVKGKITSIKDFGAFVTIDNVEGLIHISEMSWDRIEKVEDLVTIGDTIDVFILGVDKENRKISLGLKQLTPDPWEQVDATYPIGALTTGTVNRIATFGAFVKLDKGLEGLIHISELSNEHINKVEDVVSIGQKIEIKVLRVIAEEQKIGLSLKQATEEEKELTEYNTADTTTEDDTTVEVAEESEPEVETSEEVETVDSEDATK